MTLVLYAFIGGLCGILINYFSDVLPMFHRITRPVCQECHQPYSIKDYLLSCKCSYCGNKKPLRATLVFISTIVISLLLYFFPIPAFSFWAALPILMYLGVVAVIDIEHRLVLFETSIVGFVVSMIYGIALRGFLGTLLGAIGGLVIMLLFYFLGIGFNLIMGKIRSQKIDEVAFGFGDVCIGTILGLLAGWPSIVGIIIIALLAFGVFSLFFLLALILSKRYRVFTSALPFVPFLILGTIIMFYL